MSKVTDSDLVLLLHNSEEWSPVVNEEVEDTVLIRQLECCRVDGGERCGEGWNEIEAVERGEHAEFELDGIRCWWCVGDIFVPGVFGEFNTVGL